MKKNHLAKFLIGLKQLFVVFSVIILFAQCENNQSSDDSKEQNIAEKEKASSQKDVKYQILIDLTHGQKFWNDPQDKLENAGQDMERAQYLANEVSNTADSLDASAAFIKTNIDEQTLANCDLLFIPSPSSQFSEEEVQTIRNFVQEGGSLLLVMDEDYWATLAQTNTNDLIEPFGIQYGGDGPDTLTGGYTQAGNITQDSLKISYHGGRIVEGGTAFCFNTQSQEHPFGKYKELENGGRLIVLGDGMASLYMISWKDVNDYQCREFMYDIFKWLLIKA